ncbi:MAG: leucine--tRNA ligase [Candidatus Nanoperiomorbaceae bacterium]
MARRYIPAEIEPKWQQKWAHDQVYVASDFSGAPDYATYAQNSDKYAKKFVMLNEFPYPSAAGLHMGHVREYTLGDIIARSKRAEGYNVLFPMAYDAFGMPTENYAIKNHISPQSATEQSMANFRRQLDTMGYSIDWNRSFATSDPEYYRWTQWMFLQFYKAGLAFREKTWVNWCPFEKSVIANEEVVNGRHERCGTIVEKKELTQWMLKITKYADRLIDGLKNLDYPKRISQQQINWIGKSVGAEVDFILSGDKADALGKKISVFTTRPDTIYGATFLVVAPESEFVEKIINDKLADNYDNIADYAKTSEAKTDIERQENHIKTGVRIDGLTAKNPLTGEDLPIFVADYVLAGYGTGAIMAVPAHDERDFDFAKKFNLPIKQVVASKDPNAKIKLPFVAKTGVLINSDELNGLDFAAAKQALLAKNLPAIRPKVSYKLRDWVYSRQRYWGEPIPIVHCEKCGLVPVPEKDLPVLLPPTDDLEPTPDGRSPLAKIRDWVETTCPKCGGPAERETDTMPNWAGSNWYYLRYYDAHNNTNFADPDKLKYWRTVDLYLGGMEHTTLHLLYSRFHHEFLYDQGLVPTPEPYQARRGQGIVLAQDGRKMSKSLGNVIDPTEIIKAGYGADATRLAMAFIAPYDQTTPWSPDGVVGCYKFLTRVWNFAEIVAEKQSDQTSQNSLKILHSTIKKVRQDLNAPANMNFNTAVAALMEALNGLTKDATITINDFAKYVQLLAPFCPHIASEIWVEILHQSGEIHLMRMPDYDEKYLVDTTIKIAVQVNGKLRATIDVAPDEAQAKVEEMARADDNVQKFLVNKTLVKVIYVPEKILNLVVK